MNTIHNAIERRNYLQFDILTSQRIGLNKGDAKGLTPLMKANHEPNKNNATEMVSIIVLQLDGDAALSGETSAIACSYDISLYTRRRQLIT